MPGSFSLLRSSPSLGYLIYSCGSVPCLWWMYPSLVRPSFGALGHTSHFPLGTSTWNSPKHVKSKYPFVVQSLSRVQLFSTRGLQHIRLPCPSPSLSLLRLMPIESKVPSNHPNIHTGTHVPICSITYLQSCPCLLFSQALQ